MGISIALIAPYQELASDAEQVCRELGEDIIMAVGDLQQGLAEAKRLLEQNTEGFISRGGTATLISEHLNVPVVEINVNAFDLIRAINCARKLGNYIGVVGFQNVIYGVKSLEQVFDVRIEELLVRTEEDASRAVIKAKKMGVDVIVGDNISVSFGKRHKLQTILVDSGKEAIARAIQEAREVTLIRKQEQAKANQLRTILDFTFEGIVATDENGLVTLVNPAAEDMLGVSAGETVGNKAEQVLPGVSIEKTLQSGRSRLGGLRQVGSNQVVENIVPVLSSKQIVGSVTTFQNANHFQAVETKIRQELYHKGHVTHYNFNDMVTRNKKVEKLKERALQYSKAGATILITGETGSGKEILAQSIHTASLRVKGPFVAVNCAAFPENLLESELFGYEEGAFTGARKGGKKGLFEQAHQGTLFLDEIGELSLKLQARLLRVLQQKAIMRVGGDRILPVDVRIIAATHRDLESAIDKELFRPDLYYRINVLHLELSPLRERLEDLPLLVEVLFQKISRRSGQMEPELTDAAMTSLKNYNWPGNIRQLENVLERLAALRTGNRVSKEDIFEIMGNSEISTNKGIPFYLNGTLQDMEKEIIQKTLELTGFDKAKTCDKLNISQTTLWRRLKNLPKNVKNDFKTE